MSQIKNITVVGGGFAGWYAATSLLLNLPDVNVTLVETSAVPRMGVGESLGFDAPYNFKRLMGLDDDRVIMRSTGSIYKYGLHYIDIYKDQQKFYFGKFANPKVSALQKFYSKFDYADYYESWSRKEDDTGILNVWLWTHQQKNKSINDLITECNDNMPFAEMPYAPYDDNNRYVMREEEGYAYHLDAERSVFFLKNQVFKRWGGTPRFSHIESTIAKVNLHDSSSVSSIELSNGSVLTGDLFLDCSGLHRVLMSSIENNSWQDRSDQACNTACVFPSFYSDPEKEMIGSTIYNGEPHGWRFTVNLYHRRGNGYMFRNNDVDEQTIIDRMHEIGGKNMIVEPRFLRWKPGFYNTPWQGNVCALGLSAGFIDPFDATTISIQSRDLENLIDSIKQPDNDSVAKYNHLKNLSFSEVDMRLKLLFGFSKRSGPYWDLKREVARKENLEEMLKDIILDRYSDINKRLTWFWAQMYVRTVVTGEIDISKWAIPKPQDKDIAMAESFFNYNRARMNYRQQQTWPNYYQWLRKNRFDGLSSDDLWNEMHGDIRRR